MITANVTLQTEARRLAAPQGSRAHLPFGDRALISMM
jgi:hypothetical protein